MTEIGEVNETEMTESRVEELRKTVSTIQKNLEKHKIEPFERAIVGAYLVAENLLDLEDEETHPRDTFLSALEIINNALHDLEAERAGDDDDEEEEGSE